MADKEIKVNYATNSHTAKAPPAETKDAPEREEAQKIVEGKVIQRKKPLGRRIKDVFVTRDAKGVLGFVAATVLIPAAKSMFLDAVNEGTRRVMYGGDTQYRGPNGSLTGSRFSYSALSRDSMTRQTIPTTGRTSRVTRDAQDEIILSSRDEAESVLESLDGIIQQYEAVTLYDLKSLLGLPKSHVDHRWGWTSLAGSAVRQIREGYLLELPHAEPM